MSNSEPYNQSEAIKSGRNVMESQEDGGGRGGDENGFLGGVWAFFKNEGGGRMEPRKKNFLQIDTDKINLYKPA